MKLRSGLFRSFFFQEIHSKGFFFVKNGTELPETGPGKLEKKVLAVIRFFGQTKKVSFTAAIN